jgi:hypothetical protein
MLTQLIPPKMYVQTIGIYHGKTANFTCGYCSKEGAEWRHGRVGYRAKVPTKLIGTYPSTYCDTYRGMYSDTYRLVVVTVVKRELSGGTVELDTGQGCPQKISKKKDYI